MLRGVGCLDAAASPETSRAGACVWLKHANGALGRPIGRVAGHGDDGQHSAGGMLSLRTSALLAGVACWLGG